jgi:hypothetical protein
LEDDDNVNVEECRPIPTFHGTITKNLWDFEELLRISLEGVINER